MKKILIALLTTTLFLTGCSTTNSNKSETNIPKEESAAQKSKKDETLLSENQQHTPTHVVNIYDSINATINQHYPNYSLSDISEEQTGESTFYKFDISCSTTGNNPSVTFQNDEASFKVSLPDTIDNSDLRNMISCVLLSTQNIDIEKSQVYMQDLVNSFDGSNKSDVLSVDDYKYYISPSGNMTMRYLNVISVDDINTPIDTSDYQKADPEIFSGELNQGTKVSITGIITNIADIGSGSYGMEVKPSDGIYIIYYDYNDFLDVFSLGDEHEFYGTVAKPRNGYIGTMHLDYVK